MVKWNVIDNIGRKHCTMIVVSVFATVCLAVCPSVSPSVWLSVRLSVHLSVRLSVDSSGCVLSDCLHWVGAAYSRAETRVQQLVDQLRLPFLPSPMAKGVLPDKHVLCVGPARSRLLSELFWPSVGYVVLDSVLNLHCESKKHNTRYFIITVANWTNFYNSFT